MKHSEFRRAGEWLEADGLGGFASGTAGLIRTRRYHALLQTASLPPAERFVLVPGVEALLETPAGAFALSSHRYVPDVVHPNGVDHVRSFDIEPWPTWEFVLPDGTRVTHSLFTPRGAPAVVLSWRIAARDGARLIVRPLIAGRDPHALHHENNAFRFEAEAIASPSGALRFRPYDGVPAILAVARGGAPSFEAEATWYRQFLYTDERDRGLDHVEDLASPGRFTFDGGDAEVFLVLAQEGPELDEFVATHGFDPIAWRETERARRAAFLSPLDRSADAYLVRRGRGKTIVAGYPWFGDWGRDTFIALRGLCLAGGREDDAGAILTEWAGAVSEGMLPNRFPDRGETPEYNSVDASLWYVVAAHEYLATGHASKSDARRIRAAITAILDGYTKGTRHGIAMDPEDGLLFCGAPGQQLTWMDARVFEREVTPRHGKPVEIQALWLNALRLAGATTPRFADLHRRGAAAFAERFFDGERGWLRDVVDVDRRRGVVDATLRPNQILAVGGLPFPVVDGDVARAVVDAVERELWTPLGLRSLARFEPGYAPRYEGGVPERDGSYHQGTVWPWLAGPFVEAWLRVRRDTAAARTEARRRFVTPLLDHLWVAGLGHVSEIADAEPPHTPRGCPFQAWSLGELIRAYAMVHRGREALRSRPRSAADQRGGGR